ncbi:MAG TPA: chorismate synthase [Ruminococcaceae bacterium]|nr:chorismate synthase [Oscillospiraceae bacterium]
MTWGDKIKLSVFGESHGAAIGAVIDGLPAGEEIDFEEVKRQMARRAPGNDASSTKRKENDEPVVLSGVLSGMTTGAPLCAVIKNSDTHSSDYKNISRIPRPGHADYTAYVKYGGFNDVRGGGHFSGRLTAPLVFAGAVCRQVLRRRGVTVGAHVYSIYGVKDKPFDMADISPSLLDSLSGRYFPVIDGAAEKAMREKIAEAQNSLDSVGGIVECAAAGLPAGLCGPLAEGAESEISSLVFGIPACKGIEFGAGFASAQMLGSENNDPFYYGGGEVKTRTNNCGGVLGGITDGMPVVFRAAFKPTPSIGMEQESVDLEARAGARLTVRGRHDPCIVPRAVPAVEAAAAVWALSAVL